MNYLDCYIRVSTTIQAEEGNSLAVQERLAKDVAKKLNLKLRLRNEGAKSSTRGYREELEQLKFDIQQGKVKNLWIQDKTRLFRDIEGILFNRDYIEKYKVNFYEGDTAKQVRFDSAQEKFTANILILAGEFENEERARRSARGKLHRLKHDSKSKAVFLGGTALFGYMNVNKQWVINKDEAKWVKFIFKQYENKQNVKAIADELNNENVKPRRAKLWNLGTLQKMLRNKTYTGIHTVHIKKLDKTFTFKIPPIISISEFNRVQKIMDRNTKGGTGNKQHDSLLGGLLVCDCGTYIGSDYRKHKQQGKQLNTKRYYCMNKLYEWRDKKNRGCLNKKTLDMDKTDDAILRIIKKTVSDSSLLKEQFKKDVLSQKASNEKEVAKKRKLLEKKGQRIQKQIETAENNIVTLEVDKGLGKREANLVDKIINKYEHELEAQHSEYKLVEQELDNLDSELVWLDWVSKFHENLNEKTNSYKQKQTYLKGIVEKIIVKPVIGKNRNEEDIQIGHKFDIHYKRKIVNDKIEYNDAKNKRKGYKVKEGKNIYETALLNEVTAKRGRVWQKKR